MRAPQAAQPVAPGGGVSPGKPPLACRVDPFGALFASPARGGMFGNRGRKFHQALTQTVTGKPWASRQWICCVLSFKGRRREVWTKGYTELFFLDEVTALAAGHRPCFECRRADAGRFAACWQAAEGLARPPRAPEMDLVLHAERLALPKPELSAIEAAALPDGAVIASGGKAFAVRSGAALPWSPEGYGAGVTPFAAKLLTPPSIVAALRRGFSPRWHASAA